MPPHPTPWRSTARGPQPVHHLAPGAHRDPWPGDRPAVEESTGRRHRRHRQGAGAVGSFLAGRRLLLRRSHDAAGAGGPPAPRRRPGRSPTTSSASGTGRSPCRAPTARSGRWMPICRPIRAAPSRCWRSCSSTTCGPGRRTAGRGEHRPVGRAAGRDRGPQPDEPAHGPAGAGARDTEPGSCRRARPATEPRQAPPGPALADRAGAGAARHGRQLRAEHRGAIQAFQRRNGLPATGYLDSASLARLRDAAAKIAAVPTVVAPTPPAALPAAAPKAAAAAKPRVAPSEQVLCRAPSDPSWMEPRLIMLFQCNKLGGEWTLP